MDTFSNFAVTIFLGLIAGIVTWLVVPRVITGAAQRNGTEFLTRHGDHIFSILFLGFLIFFGSLPILRFIANHSGTDLAQYDQLIWNSLNGRLLENSFIVDAPLFLGKSFTPILLALVPLYALWTDARTLLILQIVACGIGALPLYWFARRRVGYLLALAIVVAYFLSPLQGYINIGEFHEIALVIPFLSFALYFLWRRHDAGFLVCLFLALITKEEVAFITIAFGAYIFLVQRRYAFGAILALFGGAWGIAVLQYVVPFFQGKGAGTTFYYFGSGAIAGAKIRYAYLGTNLAEIIQTVFTRPDIVWAHVVIPAKIEFVLHLLVPLAFMPLIGLEFLFLALPTFGYSLLSDFASQYSIAAAYTPPFIPFLFFASVVGVARVLALARTPIAARQLKATLAALIFVTAGLSYYFNSPWLLGRQFDSEPYTLTPHKALADQLMKMIPADASVVAQTELIARFSERRFIYEIPLIPDYRQADYLFADPTRQWYNVHAGFWSDFLASGYFQVVTRQDGYLIAKRIIPNTPRISFVDGVTLLGCTIPATDTIRGGMTIRPVVAWQIDQPVSNRYKFAIHLVDAAGHVWASHDGEPQDGNLPTTQWQAGKAIGDQYTLNLPPTMPRGDYAITMFVYSSTADSAPSNGAQIASVHVEKNKSSFTASELQIEQPLFVDMGEMRFIGYVPASQEIQRGEQFSIGLYWRARAKPQGDYVAVVQLRASNGQVAFEHSARPANGSYSTTEWDAGEVLLDWHDFSIPASLAPGTYQIGVSLRDSVSGKALGETVISSISVVN
ncbi:MAG: DUF2079 domain-containing protein [Chloroflexi bacterium]|nr:DUF2079 domain-containing protein [Chloroflexota bacterium]